MLPKINSRNNSPNPKKVIAMQSEGSHFGIYDYIQNFNSNF